jgi:hypothetical protein
MLTDGQKLSIVVPDNVGQDRRSITAWLDADQSRRPTHWRNEPTAPLHWPFDGGTHSIAGLVREVVKRATGQEPRTPVWGPNWIRTSDGTTLAKLAEPLP